MSALQTRAAPRIAPMPFPVSGLANIRLASKPEPQSAIDRVGSTMQLARGAVVAHEGDAANACFRVQSGCLRLSKNLPDGRRHVVDFLFAGDFFGLTEVAEFDCTVEALAPSTVCRYPRSQIEALAERDLSACNLLRRAAGAGLAAAQARGVLLARLTAAERIAAFLLTLAGRTRSGNRVALAMSRTDIGDYLGLTIETVSRVISQFRQRGLIRLLDTHHIEFANRARLEELSEGSEALAA